MLNCRSVSQLLFLLLLIEGEKVHMLVFLFFFFPPFSSSLLFRNWCLYFLSLIILVTYFLVLSMLSEATQAQVVSSASASVALVNWAVNSAFLECTLSCFFLLPSLISISY